MQFGMQIVFYIELGCSCLNLGHMATIRPGSVWLCLPNESSESEPNWAVLAWTGGGGGGAGIQALALSQPWL